MSDPILARTAPVVHPILGCLLSTALGEGIAVQDGWVSLVPRVDLGLRDGTIVHMQSCSTLSCSRGLNSSLQVKEKVLLWFLFSSDECIHLELQCVLTVKQWDCKCR